MAEAPSDPMARTRFQRLDDLVRRYGLMYENERRLRVHLGDRYVWYLRWHRRVWVCVNTFGLDALVPLCRAFDRYVDRRWEAERRAAGCEDVPWPRENGR